MRCAAHLLNLVCQADIKKHFKQTNSGAMYRNVFSKLGVFWKLIRRSQAAKKIVIEMCETQFPIPVHTRWNSYFNAIYKVFLKKEKISALFDKLKLAKLNVREWTFIDEHVKIMKPCAKALDTLQGEHEVTLGYVLPTIVVLKRKTESISHLTVCQNIKTAVLLSIKKRFPIIDLRNPQSKIHILAAPKFKMYWNIWKWWKICFPLNALISWVSWMHQAVTNHQKIIKLKMIFSQIYLVPCIHVRRIEI